MIKFPRRYAVIGNPVAHSLSPLIHADFARRTQSQMVYAALRASNSNDFDLVCKDFWENEGCGLNVTLPFKHKALLVADSATNYAQQAGAANVLARNQDGLIIAYNTDGGGMIIDLKRILGDLVDRKVLLIGAGGAAAGVIPSLIIAGVNCVHIANRTPDKAIDLANRFASDTSLNISGGGTESLETGDFDLVINATSASHKGEIVDYPEAIFSGAECAYDMSYGVADSEFLRRAHQAGVSKTSDGLGMLVEQAALSFAIWEGKMPETAETLIWLRKLYPIGIY